MNRKHRYYHTVLNVHLLTGDFARVFNRVHGTLEAPEIKTSGTAVDKFDKTKVDQHPRVRKRDTVVRAPPAGGVNLFGASSSLFVSRRALFAARKDRVRRLSLEGDAGLPGVAKSGPPRVITTPP